MEVVVLWVVGALAVFIALLVGFIRLEKRFFGID